MKNCCEDATTAELIVAMRGGSDERTAADHALAARDGADKTMAVEIQEVLDLRGSDTACLLALGAEWCGPCKVLKRALRKGRRGLAGYVDPERKLTSIKKGPSWGAGSNTITLRLQRGTASERR